MQTVFAPFTLSEVFPNTSGYDSLKMLKYRLGQLSRLETLRYCAHINLFITDPDCPRQLLANQKELLRMFLPERRFERVVQMALSLEAKTKGHGLHRAFFHREQMLTMMRYACLYSPHQAKYASPAQNNDSKKAFLESALLVSELLGKEMYSNVAMDKPGDVIKKSLLEPLRHSARYESKAMDPMRAFGRGWMIFFDYLPDSCSGFLEQFQQSTSLSLREYYICLFIVLTHYLNIPFGPNTHQRHMIRQLELGERPDLYKMLEKYLRIESQTAAEMKASLGDDESAYHNLKSLRQRPILRLDDNTAIVMDSVFHIEKAAIGPLFAAPKQTERLLNCFGYAFEKYAQAILKKMYPDVGQDVPRLVFNQVFDGDRGELDACLIDDDNLLLFEIKGRWIKDDQVLTPDFADYLVELKEKYGKAARQLARIINNLISKHASIEGHSIENTQEIFPVLVAYDSSLNVLGNAWFFEAEFSNELDAELFAGSHRFMKKGKWKIAPLTLITVDVLEDLESSTKNFDLADLLRDYFLFRDMNSQTRNTLALPDFISLSDYGRKMDFRGSVVQSAQKFFQELAEFLAQDGLDKPLSLPPNAIE